MGATKVCFSHNHSTIIYICSSEYICVAVDSNCYYSQTSPATSASANANASGALHLAQRSVMMTTLESVRAIIEEDETEVLHQTGEWILGMVENACNNRHD